MENKCGIDMKQTIEYYERNAPSFIESTIDADVSELYRSFEELLAPGCRILDLGCGSGRDSKYFIEKGYDVVAIDPSLAMCIQTKGVANILVYKMKAEEIQFFDEFDAVWACASLLHVRREDQIKVLKLIADALVTDGVFYGSWKYGDQDRFDSCRYFCDMNEKLLRMTLMKIPVFCVIKVWITQDVRHESAHQRWLNVLLRKSNAQECDRSMGDNHFREEVTTDAIPDHPK